MSLSRSVRTALAWTAAWTVVACHDTPMVVVPVVDATQAAGELRVGLGASALDAGVGEVVHVAVTLEPSDSASVRVIQGSIGYDPARLRYLGQVALDQTLTVVNGASGADTGVLTLVSFRLDGLGERAAVVSFEVLGSGYTAGLFYVSHIVAGRAGRLDAIVLGEVASTPDLSAAGEPFVSATPERLAELAGYELTDVSLRGGPLAVHPKAVKIGDCNRDTAVDALDLVAIALVAVGVDPIPSDPNDLRLCDVDLSGVLDVLDVLDVSRYAVGLPSLFGPLGHRLEAITVGSGHTCALNPSGAAYCWGLNHLGQLGDGSRTDRLAPVAVAGGHTFTSIQAGRDHTCGISAAGPTYCWGENNAGQLGDGSVVDSDVPVEVVGGHEFVVLTDMWDDHGCGLVANGEAWCWGNSQFGALGDSVELAVPTSTPVPVKGGLAFTDIGAGWHTTCGLDAAGQTFCWGVYGGAAAQLRGIPRAVATGLTFRQFEPGVDHFCGLDAAGASWCWAPTPNENDYGEFGDGNYGNSVAFVPVQTSGGHAWSTITAGWDHTCALDAAGGAWCWGVDDEGQLGDGGSTDLCGIVTFLSCRTTPTPVAGGHVFTTIDSSWDHTCGIDVSGSVWCWGSNRVGQLGVGPGVLDPYVLTPSTPVQGAAFASISAGSSHVCGLSTGGQTVCWGSNVYGQLGNGTSTTASTPEVVIGAPALSWIRAGLFHSCGLDAGGSAYCWGIGTAGELGDGTQTSSSTPVAVVGGPSAFLSIDAGGGHTCGLDIGGKAYCWGTNFAGQLGNGVLGGAVTAPDTVATQELFNEIEGGSRFTCAQGRNTGTAWCWGENTLGQLGAGVTGNQSVPVTSGMLFADIDAHPSAQHACGLTPQGQAWCWGLNTYGQLGDGTTTNSNVPTQVSGSHAFVALWVGGSHTCARDSLGEIWCWGFNSTGDLGDGTQVNSSVPVLLQGGSNFVAISLGSTFSCGIDQGDTAYCWGSNANGVLGTGTQPLALVPMEVVPF
jgi:alpha-tubulin suppressor-like RCC1 family protein